jgi:ABC-2 type transport system ATP-binding protein
MRRAGLPTVSLSLMPNAGKDAAASPPGAGAGAPHRGARTATHALAVTDLTKRYGERVALRGVSFDAAAGELVALIGPNGAGKTTMLSILAGIQPPDSGSVSRSPREIGWVPQQPAVYSKLSVAENLRLFARLERVPDTGAAVAAMLAQTDLADRADDEVGRLSGGNRQRVNIAVGLLAAPPVLLLDEPSSSLDPRQRERLWDFIARLAAGGTTVVYSTHNVQEAERYADRVLVLADGELLFTGTPRELEATVGGETGSAAAGPRDFESAFVRFLHERGH